MKKIKDIKIELLTWFFLIAASIYLYKQVVNCNIFHRKMLLKVLLCLTLIVFIIGLIILFSKKNVKLIISIINLTLVMVMIGLCFLLNTINEKAAKLFKETGNEEAIINFYALNNCIEDLYEKKDIRIIVQKSVDQANQEYALNDIQEKESTRDIVVVETENIPSAVEALYSGEGDFLVLNEIYVSLVEEINTFEHFSRDTEVMYSVSRKISETTEDFVHEDITSTPFTIYLAGCDTRSGRLTIYGRTDVNLLMTVNPNTKQVLITGIPRDAYIPNPALEYEHDKLTHLGNDGIQNSMLGISKYFDVEVDYYGEVIFESFKSIIDAIGGIDVDNPYYFDTFNGNGGQYSDRDYSFSVGTIHLTGDAALAYCRERWNLPNGDYGRNEHQTLVLKAVLNKLLSKDILVNYDAVWNAIQGQFMTDLKFGDISRLISMQIGENSEWDIVTYHLGGNGEMQGTASMGLDRKLYVVRLFDSQVSFIHDQISKMMSDEIVEQDVLPQSDETTYIPN